MASINARFSCYILIFFEANSEALKKTINSVGIDTYQKAKSQMLKQRLSNQQCLASGKPEIYWNTQGISKNGLLSSFLQTPMGLQRKYFPTGVRNNTKAITVNQDGKLRKKNRRNAKLSNKVISYCQGQIIIGKYQCCRNMLSLVFGDAAIINSSGIPVYLFKPGQLLNAVQVCSDLYGLKEIRALTDCKVKIEELKPDLSETLSLLSWNRSNMTQFKALASVPAYLKQQLSIYIEFLSIGKVPFHTDPSKCYFFSEGKLSVLGETNQNQVLQFEAGQIFTWTSCKAVLAKSKVCCLWSIPLLLLEALIDSQVYKDIIQLDLARAQLISELKDRASCISKKSTNIISGLNVPEQYLNSYVEQQRAYVERKRKSRYSLNSSTLKDTRHFITLQSAFNTVTGLNCEKYGNRNMYKKQVDNKVKMIKDSEDAPQYFSVFERTLEWLYEPKSSRKDRVYSKQHVKNHQKSQSEDHELEKTYQEQPSSFFRSFVPRTKAKTSLNSKSALLNRKLSLKGKNNSDCCMDSFLNISSLHS